MDYKIYNVIYKEEQSQKCEFDIYFNKVNSIAQKSYLFEYNPIIDILSNTERHDYIGIFSWKFPEKTMFFKKKLDFLFKSYKNYDVYTVCLGFIQLDKRYYQFTEEYHPGFFELFKLICDDLNLTVAEPKYTIYSNFVIAKWEVYQEFLEKILKPAIELLETKYKYLAWKDAQYCGPNKAGLTPDKLKEATGLDYYTFHTFILERLWSAYLESNSYLKVINLAKIKI